MRSLLFCFGVVLYSVVTAAQSTASLLPIDEAYQVSAEIKTPGILTIHWKIADDYYLYRERMKFTAGQDTKLGAATLPDGTKFHDEFAGDVETYHHNVDATVAYTAPPGATRIHLSVGYQGCHETDPKLCYPPHTKALDVDLPAGSAATGTAIPSAAHNAPGPRVTGAARYFGTAEAKAAFNTAETAKKSGNIEEAIKDYKQAVTLDPNYAAAQSEYLMIQRSHNLFALLYSPSKMSAPERTKAEHAARDKDKILENQLIAEYSAAMAKHPDQAIYPWGLGMIYNETDLAKSETLCRKALQLDKDFPQAYECLAMVSGVRGHDAEALEYERKAFELAPENSDIAGTYAYELSLAPGDESAAQIRSLLQRFPDSYVIAMTLTQHANDLKPRDARLAALEKIRKDAPSASKPAASFAAEFLYETYIADDLSKARSLAVDMAGPKKDNAQWAGRIKYVEALIKAKRELTAGHAPAALASLKSVADQKDAGPGKTWYLLQAQALDSAGRTAEAVKLLQDSFVAEPSDAVQAALSTYAAKLGKSGSQIDSDLWAAFKAKATAAKPFTLKRLDNDKPLSLADYRGQVVMVDFWYPNCGPCREGFPFLQQVAAKYKDKGLTVLAINGIEDQQDFALPYLREKHYDFVGLKGNEKFAEDIYGVKGYPTTFLIGADGNVYMQPTLYDQAHERSAELAVELLLRQAHERH